MKRHLQSWCFGGRIVGGLRLLGVLEHCLEVDLRGMKTELRMVG